MKKKSGIAMKMELYIMSLWLLFLLIFLLTLDIPISISKNSEFIGWSTLLKKNIVSLISFILMLYCFLLTKKFNHRWKGAVQPYIKIQAVKQLNYEYLTFLTTYIIPLACIDLSNKRYLLVLVILLVVIGFIFIKMDFFWGNPTLALMGYRLYEISTESIDIPNNIIVISKDILNKDDYIEWIPIDKNSWFTRRYTN